MMPNGELGYVFKSAVTANGCLMLCTHAARAASRLPFEGVRVHGRRGARVDRGAGRDAGRPRVDYSVFLPGYSPVFFRIFRVPDAIRAIENVTPLMPRMARARHT